MTDAPQTAELELRRLGVAEIGYAVSSWEATHRSGTRLPWSAYKKLHVPVIRHLINREDVNLLGAYRGEKIVGWMAWTPGKLPAVHYAFVRDGEKRKGVFGAMLDASEVGRRWIYSHRGEEAKNPNVEPGELGRRTTLDRVILPALARRGVYGTFVDATEWLERNS